MEALKLLYRDIAHSEEVRFITRFLLLFTALYYAAYFFVGITIEGGLYSPFIIENFNVLKWMSSSILYTSNFLTNLFGLDTYVDGKTLRVVNGSWIILGNGCLGLGVLSFWSAFTLAQDMPFKRKLKWMIGGLFAIYVINCLRVTILVAALANKWTTIKNLDHHLTFNIVAYAFILLMIYLFYKKTKESE